MSRAPLPDTATGEAPMPSSFDDNLDFWDEGRWAKFTRRLKEEPLIPLGLALTCWALYGATRSMRAGDKHQTNRYFRARLYAQSFTLLVLIVGSVYYKEDREKRKMYQGLLAERRSREKNEAWLRELEIRDREDREDKERMKAAREGRQVTRQQILEKLDREDAERELNNAARVKAAASASAAGGVAAGKQGVKDVEGRINGASMVEFGRSALLSEALWRWRWSK